MTLDDVYGSDQERFPLEQESRVWDAEDLGLQLPTRDLSFDAIAAPAGLAKLSWQ